MTRDEAIKILQEEINGNLELTLREWQERDEQKLFPALRMAIEALQAKPKHGEWKYYNYSDISNPYVGLYECTVCKQHEHSKRKYCPNCGAKMTGGEG